MKIVKNIINKPFWGYGLDIDVPYAQPHMYINTTPEYLEIKLYSLVNGNERMLFWHKIDLETLKSLNGFIDNTIWYVADDIAITEDSSGTPIATTIRQDQIVDVFASTLATKSSVVGPLYGYGKLPYTIYVGDSSGDFDDFTLVLRLNSLDEFIFEGPSVSSITNETVPSARSLLPSITMSSTQTTIEPDSSITISITTDPSVKEVYLEQVYGTLNKMRVPLTNGSGEFQLFSTSIASGEMVRVKAGYRKFTGVSDFSMTVS